MALPAGPWRLAEHNQERPSAISTAAKLGASLKPEFKTREFNPAFVLMQYYGYLRRDPDSAGYQFWLNILNNKVPQDSSGYRAMVCAFLTSAEYQARFSPTRTHTDEECGR